MKLRRESGGAPIELAPADLVGRGGEADVYAVKAEPALVAKIYHARAGDPHAIEARGRKIAAMLRRPPEDAMRAAGHCSIAWPVDRLLDARGDFAGFLMPRIEGRSVFEIYSPAARARAKIRPDYRFLLGVARNLAAAMAAVHARGYVVGDVNQSNLRVADNALVTLIDTDSFQVDDPDAGIVYRCLVGSPEYTPPELQGRTLADVDRTPAHDAFGLGVLVFQLLMDGLHPFAGAYVGPGDPPPIAVRIETGLFPYEGAGTLSGAAAAMVRPAPFAPPFDAHPPALRALFLQCFGRSAASRPTAAAWRDALDATMGALVACRTDRRHAYSGHLPACPWCAREKAIGAARARVAARPPRVARPGRMRAAAGARVAAGAPTQPPAAPGRFLALRILLGGTMAVAAIVGTGMFLSSRGSAPTPKAVAPRTPVAQPAAQPKQGTAPAPLAALADPPGLDPALVTVPAELQAAIRSDAQQGTLEDVVAYATSDTRYAAAIVRLAGPAPERAVFACWSKDGRDVTHVRVTTGPDVAFAGPRLEDINGDGLAEVVVALHPKDPWDRTVEIHALGRQPVREIARGALDVRLLDGQTVLVGNDLGWRDLLPGCAGCGPVGTLVFKWQNGAYVFAGPEFPGYYDDRRRELREIASTANGTSEPRYLSAVLACYMEGVHAGDSVNALRELKSALDGAGLPDDARRLREGLLRDFEFGPAGDRLARIQPGAPLMNETLPPLS